MNNYMNNLKYNKEILRKTVQEICEKITELNTLKSKIQAEMRIMQLKIEEIEDILYEESLDSF